MSEIFLALIDDLLPHEKTTPERQKSLGEKIIKAGFITHPVAVDSRHWVILDGHHRPKILKRLGCLYVPIQLVDYFDKSIKVEARRESIIVSKKIVIERALSGNLFPSKTTRHIIPDLIVGINIPLCELKKPYSSALKIIKKNTKK